MMGKILLIYLFTFLPFTLLTLSAQTVTRSYRDESLARVLVDLNKAVEDWHINFVYDDLEDFTVTCDIRRKPLDEALRMVIGYYPVSVSYDGNNIFVECTEKWEHKLMGRVIDERSQPIANANVQLLSLRDSSVQNVGVTNANGRFVVPCHDDHVIARISFVGFQTIYRQCRAGDVGVVRLRRKQETLAEVRVGKPKRRKHKETYEELAERISREVWSMSLPEFQQTTAPDQYEHSSAVVLASYDSTSYRHYQRLSVGMGCIPVLLPIMIRRVYVQGVERQRVLINDSAALNRYRMVQAPKTRWIRSWRKWGHPCLHVYGIRVVKPDGRVIDTETNSYLHPDINGEQQQLNAIPVDSLCVGDILDVFKYRDYWVNEEHFLFTHVYHYSDPVVTQKIRIRTDKKMMERLSHVFDVDDFAASPLSSHNYLLSLDSIDVPAGSERHYDNIIWNPYFRYEESYKE